MDAAGEKSTLAMIAGGPLVGLAYIILLPVTALLFILFQAARLAAGKFPMKLPSARK